MLQNRNIIIRTIIVILFIFGAITIVTSAVYASSFLAILGTSFIFWCSIFLFITPTKHVPLHLLNTSIATSMSNIERILTETGFDQKGVYLPPKNLKNSETSLVFVPKFSEQEVPSSEATDLSVLSNNQHTALFLTPPGSALLKIFEKQTVFSFTKIDLMGLQKNLLKTIGDLGLVDDVNIQLQDDKVMFELKSSIFVDSCQEAQTEFPHAHNVVGCFVSSFLACVLAKVTGKAVVILNEEINAEISRIEYKMLEK